MQLNHPSYYRANPYANQAYLPDSAFKNRKMPTTRSQMPQGQQHFDPTNKKHFQRLGYYSTIAQEQLINSKIEQNQKSPSRNIDYFRSLNSQDIQGTATNTLISKAVKNKMKAQEVLIRRQKQKQHENLLQNQLIQRRQDDRRRQQALFKIKGGNQPNYHDLAKKLRTQQSQKAQSLQKQQSYQPVVHSPPQQYANNQNQRQDKYQQYQQELGNTQAQINRLEQELKGLRDSRQRARSLYQQQKKKVEEDLRREQYQLQQKNYEKQQYEQNQRVQIGQDERNSNILSRQDARYRQYAPQNLQQQYQPSKYQQRPPSKHPIQYNNVNYQQNYAQAAPRPVSIQQSNQQRKYSYGQRINESSLPQVSDQEALKVDLSLINIRQQKNQHRRFNPTFLSYASQPIGMAGRNIVGF